MLSLGKHPAVQICKISSLIVVSGKKTHSLALNFQNDSFQIMDEIKFRQDRSLHTQHDLCRCTMGTGQLLPRTIFLPFSQERTRQAHPLSLRNTHTHNIIQTYTQMPTCTHIQTKSQICRHIYSREVKETCEEQVYYLGFGDRRHHQLYLLDLILQFHIVKTTKQLKYPSHPSH